MRHFPACHREQPRNSSSTLLQRRALFTVSRRLWRQPFHDGVFHGEGEEVIASGVVMADVITVDIFLRRAVEKFEIFDMCLERIEEAKLLFVQVIDQYLVKALAFLTGVNNVRRR